jgi:beta-xylosidase
MRSWLPVCAICWLSLSPVAVAEVSRVWVADNGDGTYRNPILHADYSDPDVIRVGQDFYMTASSFDAVPGLPILHSHDLVSWELIGHALAQQPPLEVYSRTQHGNGVWAPAIRRHNGTFYIFYPDPDFGIYQVSAQTAAGPWSPPQLVKQVKGWIDPCPFWDDDGHAYLISAMSASRSPLKSTLIVSRMSADGKQLLDEGTLVYDGHAQVDPLAQGSARHLNHDFPRAPDDPTVEGPKLYKRNGFYYIFAPAGGVPQGWQLVLRSRNIYGPYERRVVLAKGNTQINGPHQGAWVDTPSGESWFVHFQDKGPYGRVVHLEPMKWLDDWPVIGNDGTPVSTYRKPDVGKSFPITTPAESDEFDRPALGLQWQWQANPQPAWAFPAPALGSLRLYAIPPPAGAHNLWDVPNLLLQKLPAPEFTVTAKVTFAARVTDDRVGLVLMGSDYSYVGVRNERDGLYLSQIVCKDADQGAAERESPAFALPTSTFYLRAHITATAVARFSYSVNGTDFQDIGEPFPLKQGRWIGAKVGLFALGTTPVSEFGYADVDWFRVD